MTKKESQRSGRILKLTLGIQDLATSLKRFKEHRENAEAIIELGNESLQIWIQDIGRHRTK